MQNIEPLTSKNIRQIYIFLIKYENVIDSFLEIEYYTNFTIWNFEKYFTVNPIDIEI